MFPQPLAGLQGGAGAGMAPGVLLPFGLPPPITGGPSMIMSQNQSEVANLTAVLATFSNMTTVEVVGAIQSFFLASLMRQYMFNDFFAGGLGLMLIGLLGTQIQRIWGLALKAITSRKGSIQIRIPHDSEAFTWVQDWLQQFTRLSSSQYDVECHWDRKDNMDENSDERPQVRFLPEFKTAQQVTYKKETIWVQTSRGQLSTSGQDRNPGDDDLLKLLKGGHSKEDLLLSAENKKILEELIQGAMEAYFKKEEESRVTKVFRWSCDEMYWVHVGARNVRPVSSVILDVDPSMLITDAKRFLSSEAWYAERGIPHRRGYLLHGPPGCGKTSLIKALAGELKLDVALLSLSSKDLSDDLLQTAMNRMPYRSIFVLEDVDAAFSKDKDGSASAGDAESDGPCARAGVAGNSLSFSGLLNAIDGITAQEGSIVVMTTNHIEKLDPALIRPGRIDLRMYLGLASTKQAVGIFRRFYPDATPEQEAQVSATVPGGLFSPASLQGLFLEHRDDLEGLLKNLPSFVGKARSGATKPESPARSIPPSPTTSEPDFAGRDEEDKEEVTQKSKEKRRKKTKAKRQVTKEIEEQMKEVINEALRGDSTSPADGVKTENAEAAALEDGRWKTVSQVSNNRLKK